MVVPTDVESPTMGYKDHYYNLNLRSKIISVLPDAKIHTMDTRTILLIQT
jgi:hypothetical protein